MTKKLSKNQRTARTVIQVALALASTIPDFVNHVPVGAIGVQALAMSAALTYWFHLVEKLPGFPDWLKVN